MFCGQCGARIGDEATYCDGCASGRVDLILQKGLQDKAQSISTTDEPVRVEKEGTVGLKIIEDEGGGMRWLYPYSFWKNPAILITTWKVLMLSLSFPAVLAFSLYLENGIAEAAKISLMIMGIGAVALTGLLAIAYALVGWSYGGKYYVLFKMDEKGVHHIQLKSQYDKAAAMGFLTALVGLASRNFAVAGAGLMSAVRQSLYTDFSKVRSIKVREKRNVIYVNETLSRNQVYAEDEDFDFVRDYIIAHCPKGIKIK